jgi:prepilin-type N-terminal cleavage/methylation domain-containing protein
MKKENKYQESEFTLNTKIKSFTLPELLIVMIITAIVIGMAFSVLRLVQKQIHTIERNFDKTSTLALFEQRLWQDFNELNTIQVHKETLLLTSEMDTVMYSFQDAYILRNTDTIKLKLVVNDFLFLGKKTKEGTIDAISISGALELPDYEIFVQKKNDVTLFMNQQDGL